WAHGDDHRRQQTVRRHDGGDCARHAGRGRNRERGGQPGREQRRVRHQARRDREAGVGGPEPERRGCGQLHREPDGSHDGGYHGTATATAHGTLGAGVVGGETVGLVVSTAAFNNKNVGIGKPVTADLSLSGTDASNYSVNPTASTTANITALALTGTITSDSK